MFLKIGILKQFRKFHRKIPVLESLFNKVTDLRPATLPTRDSNRGVFCEIYEISVIVLQNTSGDRFRSESEKNPICGTWKISTNTNHIISAYVNIGFT